MDIGVVPHYVSIRDDTLLRTFRGSGTMYRDNSLMPKEAVRLAVLETLMQAGSLHYADLAGAIRHFTSRIVGRSLDLMGTSRNCCAMTA